jgi:uncharacterized membrane protein
MAVPFQSYPIPPGFHLAKLDTKKGLSNLQINLIFDIVFSSLAIIVGVVGLLAINRISEGGQQMFAFGAAICGALAALAIIFVINFIISLMSIFAMRDGAPEYGPEHERNVHMAFAFKWIGTIMSILAVSSIIAMSMFSSALFYGGEGIPAQLYVPVLIAIFWTVGVTFKGLMYVYFVKAIAPPEKRMLLPVGLWGIVIVGVLAIAIIGVGTLNLIARFLEAQSSGSFESYYALIQGYVGLLAGVFLAPGLAIVGYSIFLIVYLSTAKAVREGRVMPMMAAPPPTAVPTYVAGGGILQPPQEPEWPPPPQPPPE